MTTIEEQAIYCSEQGNKVTITIRASHPDLIPTYATDGAAGADLRAFITDDVILQPFETTAIPTGIYVELPRGYELQIRPRSGLALKHQVTVLNTPGTIDSDYRGEIKVVMTNFGKNPFIVTPFMRIAQCILASHATARFQIAETLSSTTRGEKGFGHSGL